MDDKLSAEDLGINLIKSGFKPLGFKCRLCGEFAGSVCLENPEELKVRHIQRNHKASDLFTLEEH